MQQHVHARRRWDEKRIILLEVDRRPFAEIISMSPSLDSTSFE